MIIENLEDFLFFVQPLHDYSIKAAMNKTGLSEYKCKKYLNEAVKLGLYTKKAMHGNGRHTAKAHRFVKQYFYTKVENATL